MINKIVIDSAGKQYVKHGETCFSLTTPKDLRVLLESLIKGYRGARIRVILGDTVSGKEWGEVNGVTGYLGRSTGSIKIPLLIHNKRSKGGPALLDNCILQLRTTGGVILWTHPNYKPSHYSTAAIGPPYWVKKDGQNLASFKTFEQAERYAAFMRGERGSK